MEQKNKPIIDIEEKKEKLDSINLELKNLYWASKERNKGIRLNKIRFESYDYPIDFLTSREYERETISNMDYAASIKELEEIKQQIIKELGI